MKNERKKNIIIIIAALFFVVFSGNIYSSVQSYKYRRLCDKYRVEVNRTTNEIELLGRTIEECQSICRELGCSIDRNIKSSRDIIELIEQIRTQVYELESCLGSFNYNDYYNYWDSYYHDEGLMD